MEVADSDFRRWSDDSVKRDAWGQGEVPPRLARCRPAPEGRARREREVPPRELAGRDDGVGSDILLYDYSKSLSGVHVRMHDLR